MNWTPRDNVPYDQDNDPADEDVVEVEDYPEGFDLVPLEERFQSWCFKFNLITWEEVRERLAQEAKLYMYL